MGMAEDKYRVMIQVGGKHNKGGPQLPPNTVAGSYVMATYLSRSLLTFIRAIAFYFAVSTVNYDVFQTNS